MRETPAVAVVGAEEQKARTDEKVVCASSSNMTFPTLSALGSPRVAVMDATARKIKEKKKQRHRVKTGRAAEVVQIGSLKFFPLSRSSVAGLKSLLKSDAVITCMLSILTVFAFAFVGQNYVKPEMGAAWSAPLAMATAFISAGAGLVGSLFGLLMFFNYHKRRVANGLAPRLAVAKACASGTAILSSALTCILASLSGNSQTGLALMALTTGLVSAPIQAIFMLMEMYALLIRPNMLVRKGQNPSASEDFDIMCGDM